MDKTYCIFGDSVTQAAYVKESWVELLRQHLEEKFKDGWVNIFNLGVGGDTTKNILDRFENEILARKPGCILFAIGINDTVLVNENDFRVNLQKLINLAKKPTENITFVGLVLGNWTGDEPYDHDKTTKYNQIIKEIAESNGCKFIPLQSELAPEDFFDGLHPNDTGHKKMFDEIKKFF